MKTITVKKDRLLEALEVNRETHGAKVQEARRVYREKIIAELEDRLAAAQRGTDIDPGFLHHLPIPRDFTDEYDRTIDQVDWEINDTIELMPQEFNQFIRDEWPWREQFMASTQAYLME